MASLKDMKKVPGQKSGYYSHDEVAEVIKNQQKINQNNIVTGLYGEDGTCKSGISLEIRSQDDIDCGRKLYIIDFDKGVLPLINEYYSEKVNDEFILNENGKRIHDPNIILINPTIRIKDGENRGGVDWKSTIEMTMSSLMYIDELDPNETAGCILDGLDTWLKNCEYNMEENELGQTNLKTKVSQKDWYIRDKPYNQALMLTKSLPCPTIFITHMKDKYDGYENGQLNKIGSEPHWGKLTPGQMFQRILCTVDNRTILGTTTFYAEVQKAKGRLYLEGKKYKIAEVKNENEYKWNGFDWGVFR